MTPTLQCRIPRAGVEAQRVAVPRTPTTPTLQCRMPRGCACGWSGGEREHCSEMERTPQTVDSELPLRHRVLAALSSASRDSSLESRCKTTGIHRHWCGQRSCKPIRISGGPWAALSPSAAALLSISSSEKTRLCSVVPTCPRVRSHACRIGCFLLEGD